MQIVQHYVQSINFIDHLLCARHCERPRIASRVRNYLWHEEVNLIAYIVFVKLNLAFYASITNYHRFTELKQYKFIISQFCSSEVCADQFLFFGSHKAGVKSFTIWALIWKLLERILFEAHSDGQQNEVSWDFRPEVISCWLSAGGLALLIQSTCIASLLGPSIFKTAKVYIALLILQVSLTTSSTSPSAPTREWSLY